MTEQQPLFGLEQFKRQVQVLDHGFIELVDTMGSDESIEKAARVSYNGDGQIRRRVETRALLRYMLKHRHTSPFEMAEIILHVKLPIFVERQWIRHRTASVNELSARYSELPEEYYVPTTDQICYQSSDNKQGRAGPVNPDEAQGFQDSCRDQAVEAFSYYHNHLEVGIAKETSRINLPLSTYTRKYWKMDVNNLMHFMKLRLDPHAQWEIRQYAEAIFKIFQVWLPITAEAFVDYQLKAVTFSRMEMKTLRLLMTTLSPAQEALVTDSLKAEGCSSREIKEFNDALQRGA